MTAFVEATLHTGLAGASMCGVNVPVSAPSWARPHVPAQARADAAIALVAQSSIGFAALALQGGIGPPLTLPVRSLAAVIAALALGGGTLLAYLGLLGAAVAVPMWAHRCYRNLPVLGSRGHLLPAWAAASWFVPIANLVLPYIVVRDLLAAAAGGRGWNAALASGWWITWIAAWALRLAGALLPWHGYQDVLASALLVVAGGSFIGIVHLVTDGQRRQSAAALA